jgi:hypothetical protein
MPLKSDGGTFFFMFFFFVLPRPVKAPGGAGGLQATTPNSLGDSNPGPPSPRGKSQPLSLIFARIGGALEPNDSLNESRDALVTHSSTFPHATRIVFRAFDRSPSELGDSLVVRYVQFGLGHENKIVNQPAVRGNMIKKDQARLRKLQQAAAAVSF